MAGAPWLDVQGDVVAGGAFARLSPITMSGTKTITAFGTAIDLLQITDESEEYTMNTPKNDVLSKELSSGYVLESPKVSRIIDATTGALKASADSGVDTFTFKAVLSKTKFDSILAGKGNPFACMKSLGFDTTGAHVGFAHIIGYIDSLKYNVKQDLVETDITIKGGVSFLGSTYGAYNTAVTTATIEPVGMGTITPKALTSDNYTALLNGTIVRTTPV